MSFPEDAHIVVVEDDVDLATAVCEELQKAKLTVTVLHDGPPLLRHVEKHGLPHLVILDLELPSAHGFDLSEALRARGNVPIIIISNRGEPGTVIQGIKKYADDYLTKPFNIDELVVRVQRVISRVAEFGYAHAPIMEIDDWLAIDFANARLKFADKRVVTLTPTEARLLHLLISRAGAVVSLNVLLSRVWPFEEVYEDTLRVHMHRLRRKIEPPDAAKPRYIQTILG
ncbi:MAG: response regulator transcription factor, partial [Anaerolineae bacterium]|nr:response regulator transcription factor [Anaerolineae bacterium]